MAFRANESTESGMESAKRMFLNPKYLNSNEISEGKIWLEEFSLKFGPVVDFYPSWHPLVSAGQKNPRCPVMYPQAESGYRGVDHTILFRNGFISCPYSGGDDEILKSISNITYPDIVNVYGEKIDITLYHPEAKPVAVYCDWEFPSQLDGTISQRAAVALMIEEEIRHWRYADVAETWDTMKGYFLGQPCGSKSSLFVNQKTGQAMKRTWESIINAGIFGPIKVDA